MSAISWLLILSGVLLNACAQLLLKAGTNSVGTFAFNTSNLLPVGIKLASERVGAGIISLPLFPGMDEDDVERVCAAVSEVLRGAVS